ncbi:MAG: glutamate--tRNA ligase [Candidatus Micrarchaeia archaeon]
MKLARKYAIKNAVEYGGKANPGSVFSKVLSKVGKSADIKSLQLEIQKVVEEVNAMSKASQEEEYSKYKEEFEQEYSEKVKNTSAPRMELKGAVKGNFSTRFAPEPSGYMHIGHAKVVFMEQEFARIYEGKLFLYFDDTNPEKESQEFVDAIKRDLDWLGIKFDKEYYASDSIEKLYEYARQLIKMGKAYVCTCPPETIKSYRMKGLSCPHSKNPESENMMMFQEMLEGDYDEGQAILRFRGDMSSNNTVMRDPTIMRIKKHMHYRQGDKYIVWPTYDFNTPVMDSLHGVTDAMRSKEYELRGEIYVEILKALNLRIPRVHHEARLEVKGSLTSKRKLNDLINKGLISGYDDPRLITISALRRRGIKPEAIKKFVMRFGMSMTNSVVDLSLLYAENKKLVDPSAKRLFYVADPVKVIVENVEALPKGVSLKLHPSNDLGSRSYAVGNTFYISGSDANELDMGTNVRLKELADLRVLSISKEAVHAEVVKMGAGEAKSIKKIQWVPEESKFDCKILIPKDLVDDNENFLQDSLQESNGYIESFAESLKKGEVVQLERFGFATFDKDEGKVKQFIYISA